MLQQVTVICSFAVRNRADGIANNLIFFNGLGPFKFSICLPYFQHMKNLNIGPNLGNESNNINVLNLATFFFNLNKKIKDKINCDCFIYNHP